MEPSVLVVEDEDAIVTMLRYNLEREGFRVYSTADGEEALALIKQKKPDVIILDWMLPSMSGVEVCRKLRKEPEVKNTPVIMLSARGEEDDRVHGLDSGADDYLVKPFSPSELIARIRAVFRRIRPAMAQETLEYENISMDISGHRVTRNGVDVHLGPTEFRLMRYFMENPGRVFSREHLLDVVWGHEIYVELRTVDVHIRRLRKALNYDNKQQDLIRTIRSRGYALEIGGENDEDEDAA